MFFSGDSSTRKRVDLGGRSSKERDRQMLLEQARLERKKRMSVRQQNAAALKIQKCLRGRKAVALERSNVREQFFNTFGDCCQNMNRDCFSPHSDFLRQLLFFFKANNHDDFIILVETCRKLLQIIGNNGNVLDIIAGKNYSKDHALVDNRLKCLSYACLEAVHHNRDRLKEQFLTDMKFYNMPAVILLDTMVALLNPVLPWASKIGGYLAQRKAFNLLREILLVGMHARKTSGSPQKLTSLERVLILIASHASHDPCYLKMDPRWCFSPQILSIPLLWQHLPHLKEAFATCELIKQNIHQMSMCVNKHLDVFSDDFSHEFPGHACLLGNLLEASTIALAQPFCNRTMAADFAIVMSYLLQALPPTKASTRENLNFGNEMMVDDEDTKSLNPKLERQISNAMDPRLLELLVNSLFRLNLHSYTFEELSSGEEVTAIGAICLFLHVTFSVLPVERIMTVLAYRTDIVFILWNFLKRCHDDQQWPSFSRLAVHLPEDAPGWILPLAVFCPMYKHMLMIIDNEEFYEQEKPLSLKDIRYLIIILRQALWELLWLSPGNIPSSQKGSHCNRLSGDTLKQRVKLVSSELLSQLQDWNNRRPFTSSSDFHAPEAVGDSFVSQALNANTRTEDVLKHAPFLVPFTSRVKIFTSQLASFRKRDDHHPGFTRFRFKIRRNQIFEDAFNQLRTLSEDELRGMIRVSFINEAGAEEAGIDGGGMFKDFMENAIRAGFDVQYGLFKETTDHLLYPNPGSEMIHEQHLHFFHFLGTLLGKAMFEGILVDIPFAMFFLSKLKQKYNYLNDLPSLDPELYRHLLFLKHYKGDVSELELYFVVVNNDYGEQREEELISGGKNIRVTKDNVITFIHLIANYRLNFQIRHQSLHFLRGFQKIIQKEWIDMFNEHEIQLLISGSLDGMDVNDLRSNAQYSGGYHQDHVVIDMFWDVIKSFSSDHQKKFLKFVTGCSRGPLLGFKYLEPKFCIQRAAPLEITGGNLDRLPTSATCMNLLKLPPYRSKEQLRAKLFYAISAEAGFDLS